MNIVLKKIRYNDRMSDETSCFSAEIWMDGQKLADVSNQGCGGSNAYYPVGGYSNPKWTELCEWCKKQPPHIYQGISIEMDTDLYISDLLEEWLKKEDTRRVQAQIKRWCKTKTVYRLKGDAPGKWWVLKTPYSPKVKEQIVTKYGDTIETIANEGASP